jgi:hypothetical protein
MAVLLSGQRGNSMRRMLALLVMSILFGLLPTRLLAQNSTLLSLESASTNIQTGQPYEVNIRLDNAAEVWLADMQISYDPTMIYIFGTKAGSPITQGSLFNPGASTVIRNAVENDTVLYTLSMLAPADPVSGGGIVGTLRIYPLAPGATQLTFSRGELSKAIFEIQNGQRVGVGSEQLTFTPVLLDLTISGAKVEPPSEATATPPPTETPVPQAAENFPTEIPTLVNATAAPRTPEALATQPIPVDNPGSGSSSVLIIAIIAMVVGALGTAAAVIIARRRR